MTHPLHQPPTQNLTYDGENRPLSVLYQGQATSYTYGVDGIRLKRIEGGATTLTFTNIEVRNFKPGAEAVVSYPHPSVRLENGNPSYLHRDHIGSIQLITDVAGAQEIRRFYKPFGEMFWTAKAPIEKRTKSAAKTFLMICILPVVMNSKRLGQKA